MHRIVFPAVAAFLLQQSAVFAAGMEERGKEIAEQNCARCHQIAITGESPHPVAPPFRTLAQRWPLEQLEEALAEGLVTGHPDMPEFVFPPDDIEALIAYLSSIAQ